LFGVAIVVPIPCRFRSAGRSGTVPVNRPPRPPAAPSAPVS